MDERLKEIHELCKRAGAWPIRWPEIAIEEPERCRFIAHMLAGLRDEFNAGDSLALVETVRLSWEEDFRLPHWAHGCLAKAFDEFLAGGGDKSLDALLKLQRGRGRDNDPFKRRDRRGMNNEIVFHVCFLNEYLNFSLPVTHLILSKKQIRYSDGRKEISTVLSASRIEEIYKSSERRFSLNELTADGFEPENRLDWFMRDYADIFSQLYDDGTLQEMGLLSSALRSFRALFPHLEPPPLPTTEESGG